MHRRVSDHPAADAATLSDVLTLAALERHTHADDSDINVRITASGVPTNRSNGATLDDDVRAMSAPIAEAREAAGTAWTAFDEARAAIAGTPAAQDPESPEFQNVEALSRTYNEAADTYTTLQDTRERLLALTIGGGERHQARSTNGPEDGRRTVADALTPDVRQTASAIALASDGYKLLKANGAFNVKGRKSVEAVLLAAGDIDDPNDPTFMQARDQLAHALRGGGGTQAALVTGSADDSAGALVTPQRLPGIAVPMLHRPLRLLDLITVGQTDSDTVEYVEMTGFTNNAAEVAEATAASGSSGTKPESALALIEREVTVKTIAHWIPATKRALADAGQLRTLIDGILRLGLDLRLDQQIVTGSGTGENLRGIRNTPGIGSVELVVPASGNTNTPETILDTLHRAITVVRMAFFEPTAIGIHPADWERVRLARAGKAAVANASGAAGSVAEGAYLMGDPSTSGAERIWGLMPVISAAFAEGHPVVGDFRQAVLWLREGIQVLASDSHMDFFIRNLVAILAEFRAAFGVLAPSAFCEADLT